MSEQKRLDRPDREKKTALLHIVLEANKDISQASPNTWAFTLRGINKILALLPDIEEAKREERERIIEELREGAKLIWAFINKEKGKGNDASLLITVRNMVHDMIEGQALKGEK